jgi:hypothetical protein
MAISLDFVRIAMLPDYVKMAKEIGLPLPGHDDSPVVDVNMDYLDIVIRCYKRNSGHGDFYAKSVCHSKYSDNIVEVCRDLFQKRDNPYEIDAKCSDFRLALRLIAKYPQ